MYLRNDQYHQDQLHWDFDKTNLEGLKWLTITYWHTQINYGHAFNIFKFTETSSPELVGTKLLILPIKAVFLGTPKF